MYVCMYICVNLVQMQICVMLTSFINTLHRYAQLVKLIASIEIRIKYKIIIAHSAFVLVFISSLFDLVSENRGPVS